MSPFDIFASSSASLRGSRLLSTKSSTRDSNLALVILWTKCFGPELSIVIKASSGLSDEDIEKMVKDAEANAEDDKKFEELVKTKNNADMLVHATRKTIEESEDKLEDEEKNQVEEALKGLEEAISSEDIEAIESATKNLNDVLTPLTQKLYKQESAEGQSDTNTDEDSSTENTVDAEFEEVKEEEK